MSALPLIVDLDGTLIHTDMLQESALKALAKSPLSALKIPYWLSKGKAVLKKHLAHRVQVDPSTLPYNQELLTWLKQQHAQGRKLVLCTGADLSIAKNISEHLGIFDEVIASEGTINLTGAQKAKRLTERFGHEGFDYAGNSKVDLSVWKCARRAIVVNGRATLLEDKALQPKIEHVFLPVMPTLNTWGHVLRVHQWLKNLLLFVPMFAAHQVTNPETWLMLMVAFFSFCFCASSVYVINDLLDLESDRQHPRKCKRPFASGKIPVWVGVFLAPILLSLSAVLASYAGDNFFKCLIAYFALTCLYSLKLKQLVIVDCITLGMLYTLRIVAGTVVSSVGFSFWLLTFSIFLFLSLAFLKRYSELEVQLLSGNTKAHGRGYLTADAPLVQNFGIASGYGAVLVLALYLHSDVVLSLYRSAEFLWGTVPIMLFWISYMWMQAYRGKMHDDPLVFAVKSRMSLLAGLAFVLMLVLATIGLPW